MTMPEPAESDQQLIAALRQHRAELAGKFARPQTVPGVICSKIAWSTVDRQAAARVADECADAVMALPLAVRAPEVGVLLAEIRNTIEGPDGSWNGGDTVALLCEWFTEHGYKVDGPRPA
jgi:hypothetical protein